MPATRLALAALALAVLGASAPAAEPRFKKHDINPRSPFEAAGVFDADGDGTLDIVSGDTWYKGPDFKQTFKVRDVAQVGKYYNCFSTIPMDVNADGKMDYVSCSYFGKNIGWVENPGVAGKEWTYHPIALPGASEAAVAVDLDGDGKPDILPNTVNVVVWYSLEKAGPEPVWKKHDFGALSNKANGHGVGSGDVNGDGRTDLLTPKGWFEAPPDSKSESWTWHPDWQIGATGIQILARDVDGDGLSDVVYGMGHNYGLYWLKQGKGPGGERVWDKRTIDDSVASVHTLLWADLNGDGKADELVTGKRVYAHEVEPGATDGSVVAWYDFDRVAGKWTRHLIYQGEPAKDAPAKGADRNAQKDFPVGTAGTGLEMTAVDIDRDGDIDLVCPGKSGLYLFENLGTGR
jgi:hypothetical protein